MSTVEANKAIVRRVLEEFWHEGNQSVLDELFSQDFVNHDQSQPEVVGLDAFRHWANAGREAYAVGMPDRRWTIEDLIGEGDLVAKRWVLRGTHTGEFMGFPASSRRVMVRGVSIYRLADGKVKEIWWNYDAAGLLQQLQTPEAALAAVPVGA